MCNVGSLKKLTFYGLRSLLFSLRFSSLIAASAPPSVAGGVTFADGIILGNLV